jgi:hypothetical protein
MWMNFGQESKKDKSEICGSKVKENLMGQNVEIKVKLVKVAEFASVEVVKNYNVNN